MIIGHYVSLRILKSIYHSLVQCISIPLLWEYSIFHEIRLNQKNPEKDQL